MFSSRAALETQHGTISGIIALTLLFHAVITYDCCIANHQPARRVKKVQLM